MTRLLTPVLAVALSLIVNATLADTLELADGTLLEGDFVGSSNGIIMFNTGESIEAFPESEVVGVFLSSGVATAIEMANSPAPATVTIPSGTRLVIRISNNIDSSKQGVGHRFRGQLEGALVVDGVTAAPRGSVVHGVITQASQGGRLVGSSEMSIEFTDLMINDQLFEIATEGMQAQTGNEAANTLGRTARAAAIGGLISGRSGAATGAKVGAGASLLTSGQRISIPAGTIVETRLRVPVTVPR
jgi:hypothetical protein